MSQHYTTRGPVPVPITITRTPNFSSITRFESSPPSSGYSTSPTFSASPTYSSTPATPPFQRTYTSTPTTPPTFRNLFTKLAPLLSTSRNLCTTIRHTRRLSPSGTATTTLAHLESALDAAIPQLAQHYANLQRSLGARLDVGDAEARRVLQDVLARLDKDVRGRLEDIADRRAGSREKSGFNDVREVLAECVQIVGGVLEALAARLGEGAAKSPVEDRRDGEKLRERRRERETPRLLEEDEVAIDYRQFDRMNSIWQNCWEEVEIEGIGRRYVNCANRGIIVERVSEGAFVRGLRR